MNDLDLIKRIAEIEGVRVEQINDFLVKIPDGLVTSRSSYDELLPPAKNVFNHSDGNKYNPLTDKALNCELRDKHEAEIYYDYQTVTIPPNSNNIGFAVVDFKSKEEIPRAVLLCIIEAKAND